MRYRHRPLLLGLIPVAAVKDTGAIRSGTLVKLLQLIQANVSASANWHELTRFLEQIMGSEAMESTSLFAGAATPCGL
jgi:ATP-dependent helicase/nuclease subunit A